MKRFWRGLWRVEPIHGVAPGHLLLVIAVLLLYIWLR